MRRLAALAFALALAGPAQAQLLNPTDKSALGSDRPGLAFSTSVVPPGRVVLELGAPEVRQVGDVRIGVPSPPFSVPAVTSTLTRVTTPLQVRYGLAGGVELRASTSLLNANSFTDQGEIEVDADGDGLGFGSIELGAKVRALSLGPASVAAIPSVTIPFEESQSFGGSVRLVAGGPLGAGLGGTLVLGLVQSDFGNEDSLTSEVVGLVSGGVARGVSLYAEAAAFPDESTELYAGGGVLVLLLDDLQLDASFDIGLNGPADDGRYGLGVAARF